MDIRSFLNFVAAHVEQIFGTTLVLTFLTGLLLLIRSIGSKDEHSSNDTQSAGATVHIDAKTIEEAMKRALGGQTLHSALAPADSSSRVTQVVAGDVASLSQAVQSRDERIENMTKELEKLRTANVAASAGGDSASNPEILALQAKVEEMQARLAEYEIIEDDIADLSMFKEENLRLKGEVESLKSQLAELSVDRPAANEPVRAAAAVSAPESIESNFEKSEKFELDPNDDVMKQFAAAMEVQRAPPMETATGIPPTANPTSATDPMTTEDPQSTIDTMLAEAQSQLESSSPPLVAKPAREQPKEKMPADRVPTEFDEPASMIDSILANAAQQSAPGKKPSHASSEQSSADGEDVFSGAMDADKMLSEVASLAELNESDTSALEDTLDTDKLLSEVGILTETERPIRSAEQQTGAGSTPSAAALRAASDAKKAEAATEDGDDLLAEFKS